MGENTERPDAPDPTGPESTRSGEDVVWERWPEIDALLERVLDVPEADRAGFLADACPNDPELYAVVRSLARIGS